MAGVLEGITVLDLTISVAGPMAAVMFADAGARVIKLEGIGRDVASEWDSLVYGMSSLYVSNSRGKESIALNLKDERGREAARRLAERADVIIENFSPGTIARLGLGYAEVARTNPRVIYAHISGYGQTGPYRDEKAFDLLVQGEAGYISINGTPETPCKVAISAVDIAAAMYANQAVLLALIHRQTTGRGTEIDISMLHSAVSWLGYFPYFYWFNGEIPARTDSRHFLITPYGPYRCSDGKAVNIAVASQAAWTAFCQRAVERPEWLADERFASNELRVRNRGVLEALVAETIAEKTRAEWLERLHAAGIPCGSVRDIGEVLDHPQLRHAGAIVEVASAAGPIPLIANPVALADAPPHHGRVPLHGEHTRAVLRELGYSDGDLDALVAAGVAGEPQRTAL